MDKKTREGVIRAIAWLEQWQMTEAMDVKRLLTEYTVLKREMEDTSSPKFTEISGAWV